MRRRHYFNPRHPYGWRRHPAEDPCDADSHFNPRHPYGWRQAIQRYGTDPHDFNPRHPYGWRRADTAVTGRVINISIHATHTGGDVVFARRKGRRFMNFNPRHPYGWRLFTYFSPFSKILFQSTPPIRVATGTTFFTSQIISFQSTPPIRVATGMEFPGLYKHIISIHATHTGGDSWGPCRRSCRSYFNPRHPYGWRLRTLKHSISLPLKPLLREPCRTKLFLQ